MFSTMMTVESTMMPKSTAPIDSRLADLPRRNSTEKANSRASGMLIATMSAAADVAEEHQQDHRHQRHADEQVLVDRLGGEVDQVGAVVVGLDLDARQQLAGLVQLLDLGLHVARGRAATRSLAQQHDPLDHVVLVVPDRTSRPALSTRRPSASLRGRLMPTWPRRVWCDDHAARHQRRESSTRGGAVGIEHRAAVDDLIDPHRHVVHAGDHHLPDLAQPPGLLGAEVASRPRPGSVIARTSLVRVLPLPDQTRATAPPRSVWPWVQVVAAAVGVRAAERRLELG